MLVELSDALIWKVLHHNQKLILSTRRISLYHLIALIRFFHIFFLSELLSLLLLLLLLLLSMVSSLWWLFLLIIFFASDPGDFPAGRALGARGRKGERMGRRKVQGHSAVVGWW